MPEQGEVLQQKNKPKNKPNPQMMIALHNLSQEEILRLQNRLWRKFGKQLDNIKGEKGGANPDDLLAEAFEDVLNGKRNFDLDRYRLVDCLYGIVRSKVSNLYTALQKTPIYEIPLEESRVTNIPDTSFPDSELHDAMLALVQDDAVLTQIVEYHLDHSDEEPIKAQALADALAIDITEIYNANRRLKARLNVLI